MSTKDLEKQIETDLAHLKELLSTLEAPQRFDQRLHDLVQILLNNPGCFVTVAPTALKIRSKKDERLAKVDADFKGVPDDIGVRITRGMRNKDLAYMFLLGLQANSMWKRVKFNYRNSQPRQKEITLISKLQDDMHKLCTDGPILLMLGGKTLEINGVVDVPNVPKADFAFTLDGVPCIYISHKDKAENATHSDSFRQYGGITKFCLDELAGHEEILTFKSELADGFTKSGLELKNMRKGSYFAKRIDSKELILASIFGKDYLSPISSIHNVDIILHGDVNLQMIDGKYVIESSHQLLHPRHLQTEFELTEEFEPHLIVMKSTHCHQGFKNARIAIWPKNKSVVRGLANFKKFFVDGDYDSFKRTENSNTPNK